MDQYAAYDKELNDNRLFGMLDTKMNGKLDHVGTDGSYRQAVCGQLRQDRHRS